MLSMMNDQPFPYLTHDLLFLILLHLHSPLKRMDLWVSAPRSYIHQTNTQLTLSHNSHGHTAHTTHTVTQLTLSHNSHGHSSFLPFHVRPPAVRSAALSLSLYPHEKQDWPGGYEPADCARRSGGDRRCATHKTWIGGRSENTLVGQTVVGQTLQLIWRGAHLTALCVGLILTMALPS